MRQTYLRIINVGLALSFIGFHANAQSPSRCGTSYSHELSTEFVEQQKTDKARFELFMNNADVSRESATPTIMVEIPIVLMKLVIGWG
jgi:hypothetical protein